MEPLVGITSFRNHIVLPTKIDFFWGSLFHEKVAIFSHLTSVTFSTVFLFSTTTPDIITPFRGKQKSPSSGLAAAICTATAMEYSPCQHESLLSEYDWLSSTTDCNCSVVYSQKDSTYWNVKLYYPLLKSLLRAQKSSTQLAVSF